MARGIVRQKLDLSGLKKVSKNSFDNFDDVFKFVERLTYENSIRLRITDLLKSMMSL